MRSVFLRITAIILCVMLVVWVSGCSRSLGATTSIDISASYEPLMGSYANDILLFYNPDRGYRTQVVLSMMHTADKAEDWRALIMSDGLEENKDKISRLYNLYFPGRMQYQSNLTIVYTYFPDHNRSEICDECLETFEYFLDFMRLKKKKVLLRVTCGSSQITWTASEENRKKAEAACADEETTLLNIERLAPVIAENKDVIHKISSGFIGNGEMVYEFQYPPVDFENIITAIVEKWCVPNGLYFTVRMPQYKIDLLEEYPDYPYADYIGFNNDAIYGEQTNAGWNSACLQHKHNGSQSETNCNLSAHTANDWWQYIIDNAAYTPQSGEMFTNSALVDYGKEPMGFQVIKEMAHFRYTTMSHWHSMYELGSGGGIMENWIEDEVVTAEWCDANGIIYDPNWFLNDNGVVIMRNPYEFIRDHLGYKIVAECSNIKGKLGKNGKLNVDMTFKNYGFAAAFTLESGFAILDEKYNLVTSVEAGEPDKWISLPADYYSTERNSSVRDDIITHNISAELTLPEQSGAYYIAFYLKSTNGEFAELSNDLESIPFEGDGYNILHKIEVK